MFCSFGHAVCGILAPQPGIEPAPLELEGKVLTTGPPEKSLDYVLEDERGKIWISLSLITNNDHMLDILFLSKPCQIYTLLLPFFLLLFPVTNNAYGSSTPQLLCLYLFSTDRAKGSLTTIPRLLCLLLPICLCQWEALAGDWKAGRKASQSRLSEWPRLCMMLFLFGSFRPKHCSGFPGWHHFFSSSRLSNTF